MRCRADRGRTLLGELGPSITAATTSIEASRIHLLAGDAEAAEALLRRDIADLEALGEVYYRSTVAGLLARVIVGRGDPAEASRYADVAAELADPDDTLSQTLWRRARALVAVHEDDAVTAGRLAEEAVAIAAATEDIALAAGAHEDLAAVLEATGHPEGCEPALRQALELFERKGDLVDAARVRARLSAVPA